METAVSTLGEQLARKVRALRQERGMSQVELAEALGVGQSTIAGMERVSAGRSSFNLATLESLAWALDADLVVELRPR